MSDPFQIEDEIKAVAVGPKVTAEDIEAAIVSTAYFTAEAGALGYLVAREFREAPLMKTIELTRQAVEMTAPPGPLSLLTICCLVLNNGFTVVGTSACADPASFNEQFGREQAKRNAIQQVWPLMGFELRCRLTRREKLLEKVVVKEPSQEGLRFNPYKRFETYVGTKVVHAVPMDLGSYNDLRGWAIDGKEDPGREGYLLEYTDREDCNVEGFRGYVSWTPKEVFDQAYRRLDDLSDEVLTVGKQTA